MPADATPLPADWLVPGWDTRPLDDALRTYREDGFAVLPAVASPDAITALQARADDLMHGRCNVADFFYQHDAPTGRAEDVPLGEGWIGPRSTYRKLEKLERDPLFRAWLGNPFFARIATSIIGPDVTLYRAILMNKAAHGGTHVPWHQDGGALWGLDRNPQLQLWTALDDAPADAGCLVVQLGSHHGGLASRLGGVVPPERVAQSPYPSVPVPVCAGDVVMIHNLGWHMSDVNHTDRPRRGFSVCFLDAATRCVRKRKAPRIFPRIFGAPLAPIG